MAESRGRSFAQLLRQYRRDAGLTQEELAERASISVRAVSDLERGQRTRPRRDTVELLVSALALQPNDQAVLEACISRKRTTEKAALPKHAWGGLPAEITPLVGRELEEAGLIRLLTDRRARLITVTGPGGVGKTSLAIRVARTALQSRLARDFVFISLAPLRMASLVLPSLAAALDVPEGNRAELANAIARVIDGRDMLIVLDNFEHVQEAALDISNLLNTASDVTFLVTSREPLNLRGEHLFQLAPLSLPAQEESVTARDLPRYPALSLFLQRARAVQELDAPSDADAETVCAICRRIDGLPLAIELAAAQLRHVGPETLLQRLTGGMDALAAGPRDLPDRQQTMHDTIAWSYGLLNPGAKAVFRAASVLSGEFDAGAVRFLLSRSEAPSDNAMAEIEALCEKSLLLRNAMGKTGARFQMLETIREFAGRALDAEGEGEIVRSRQAEFYQALAEELGPALNGAEHAAAWAGLEADGPNFTVALQWLAANQRAEPGLRMAATLWPYWQQAGRYREGREWLEGFLRLDADVSPAVRASAIEGAARLAYWMTDFAGARSHWISAMDVCQDMEDREGVASALTGLGIIALEMGSYREAVSYHERSLVVRREIGRPLELASALGNIAHALRYTGDFERAEAFYHEALILFRGISPDLPAIPNVLIHLAYLSEERVRYDLARSYATESLELARKGKRPHFTAGAMLVLGNVSIGEGRLDEAEEWYRQAMDIFASIGSRINIALVHANLANLSRARGELDTARDLAQQSLTEARAIGSDRTAAFAHMYLGDIARDCRQYEDAAVSYRECLRINCGLGLKPGIVECAEHLGWLEVELRQSERAAALMSFAASMRDVLGVPLSPEAQGQHDQALARSRADLDDTSFQSAWDRGTGLKIEEFEGLAVNLAAGT